MQRLAPCAASLRRLTLLASKKAVLMNVAAAILTGCAAAPGLSSPGGPSMPEGRQSPAAWVSGVYSNVCTCEHTLPGRDRAGRCSLTALLASGEPIIDERTAYFSLKRPDATHLEILGYAPASGGYKGTYHLKAELHQTVSGLDVTLYRKPTLGVGMVAAIPLVGAGVKSATLRLAIVDDETLMGLFKYTEKAIVLPLIPVHEEHLVKFTCKKAMPAIPPTQLEP